MLFPRLCKPQNTTTGDSAVYSLLNKSDKKEISLWRANSEEYKTANKFAKYVISMPLQASK
jgi:hypothetical protein